MESFVPLQFPPGVVRQGTAYSAQGRWYNSDLIRFRGNIVMPVGGWQLARTGAGAEIQVSGYPRCAWTWRKNDSTAWLGVGTHTKLYAYSSATLTDITPAGLVTGAADGALLSGTGGWGTSPWGTSEWGGASVAGTIRDADTWQLDNFGEILVATLTADGKLYESTPTTQATQITNSPTGCRGVVVTPERFIFALGASSDPRNVAWCSQSARTVWTPSATNSAGAFALQTAGRLMAGRRTDRETLLWTDADLWSAEYIGGTLYYRFTRKGTNCGLLGPNAIASLEGAVYWMGTGRFFRYGGAVQEMPCDVADEVFGSLNIAQKAKVAAFSMAQFGEVWWCYPGLDQAGRENDRYVKLNVNTGAWDVGTLARAAGADAGAFALPLLVAPDGRLYTHELGQDRQGMTAFIESGPMEVGNGERVVQVQSIIPDERVLGRVNVSLYSTYEPMQAESLAGPYVLSSRTDVRLSGRQFRVRLAEPVGGSGLEADTTMVSGDGTSVTADGGPGAGQDFRVGTFRLGIVTGGRR